MFTSSYNITNLHDPDLWAAGHRHRMNGMRKITFGWQMQHSISVGHILPQSHVRQYQREMWRTSVCVNMGAIAKSQVKEYFFACYVVYTNKLCYTHWQSAWCLIALCKWPLGATFFFLSYVCVRSVCTSFLTQNDKEPFQPAALFMLAVRSTIIRTTFTRSNVWQFSPNSHFRAY